MKLRCVTMECLLSKFDPSVHGAILDRIQVMQATHVVLAENLQADSPQYGRRTALCVGPECTYRTPQECEDRWLRDLPSERQYFIEYAAVDSY